MKDSELPETYPPRSKADEVIDIAEHGAYRAERRIRHGNHSIGDVTYIFLMLRNGDKWRELDIMSAADWEDLRQILSKLPVRVNIKLKVE